MELSVFFNNKRRNSNMHYNKLLIIFFSILNLQVFSQNCDGYKYVYVPDLIYNEGIDIYDVSKFVREQLKEKGFEIIDIKSPPKDLQENQCLLLQCLIKTSTGSAPDAFGGTATTGVVEIVLMNCENVDVYKDIGTTQYGRPWNIVFQKSVSRALKNLTYSYNPNSFKHEIKPLFPKVENTYETDETLKEYFSSNVLEPIEGIYKSYQSDNLGYYKIAIKKFGNIYKAILLESEITIWKKGEVKAEFEHSSIKDVYSVKWYAANKTSQETFGNIEDGKILSIELVNKNTGEKAQSKFIKIFPVAKLDENNENFSGASGSGFVLSKTGILATNSHVVNNAKKIEVTFLNGGEQIIYKAKVLLKDDINDVAILKVEDELFSEFENIPYGFIENTEIGEKVFTIGYPLNDILGSNYKVTDGIISSQSGIADDIRFMQITVPIQPGNSGGPLFNENGNIVGITTAKLNEAAVGTSVENINYAIKISYLLNLYRMLPDKEELSKNLNLENLELKEQIKLLKNFVCLVKVYY